MSKKWIALIALFLGTSQIAEASHARLKYFRIDTDLLKAKLLVLSSEVQEGKLKLLEVPAQTKELLSDLSADLEHSLLPLAPGIDLEKTEVKLARWNRLLDLNLLPLEDYLDLLNAELNLFQKKQLELESAVIGDHGVEK